MDIAVIGPGRVGCALASRASSAGHHVHAGVRDLHGDTARAVQREVPGAAVTQVEDAVAHASLVLLTVPFGAAEQAVRAVGDFDGRILVDCTNPVGPGITHALGTRSGAETIAEAAHGARVVKAFNVYGVENLADPDFGHASVRGALPLAGDDDEARATVASLATDMGWEPVDVGPLTRALDLEHLALLWIWMARGRGDDPHFVWARLRRG